MIRFSSWNTTKALEKFFLENKVAVGPSDTVIGLWAAVTAETFNRLNDIKGRQKKPYLIVIGALTQAEQFVEFDEVSPLFFDFIDTYWPGPVTCIVPAKKEVPWFAKSEDGTIAIRCIYDGAIAHVALAVGGLFSTSANLSGMPVATSLATLDKKLVKKVDGIIGDPLEEYAPVPSTIIDCTKNSIRLVRQGVTVIDDKFFL